MGLEPDSVNSYVLDQDPIPRALLSMDPTFAWLRSWGVVGQALKAGSSLLGWPPLSDAPSLVHNAGNVYLLRWSPDVGHQVRTNPYRLYGL